MLDPLFCARLGSQHGDGETRIAELVDAFNSVKQEYGAARYSTWLAFGEGSPARGDMAEISARISFLDSLKYARFGIRTGVAVQAFASATNVLDKVAGFVHLYLGSTRRVRDVYFNSLWAPRRAKPRVLDLALATALQKPERNIGLLALVDLSTDLERDTLISRLTGLRHTATHRFLVAHTEAVREKTDWIDRVPWWELKGAALAQLRIARGALVYLARTIDVHEMAVDRASGA